MHKKIWVVLLMAVLLLSACQGEGTAGPLPTAPVATTAGFTEASEAPSGTQPEATPATQASHSPATEAPTAPATEAPTDPPTAPVTEAPTEASFPESSDPNCLHAVDFEIHIDESRGEVDSRLLLQNTGEAAFRGSLSLPLFSGGMKDGSLQLEIKGQGEAGLQSGEKALLYLPPGESLLLTYSYESGRDLAQASLIGFDLRSLCFRDGAGIGRVSFSILMAEEDLPLVKDIRPINWTLDKQTLSLELYDVAPSPLLDRIYVEKETYRNLKSQTFMKYEYEQETGSVLVEEETPELVKTILSSYRRWFQEGIGDESFPRDVELLFAKMCGYDISKTQDMFPPWYGDYQSLSYYENQGYKNLVVYLILREMGKQSLDQKSAFSMCAGLLQGSNHRKNAAIWPVNRELMRQMLFLTDI